MTTQNNIKTLNWFLENRYKMVRCQGQDFHCKKGLPTPGGFYKNGYIVKSVDHKGKTFIQIDIYTSAANIIDVEERFLFLVKDEQWIIKKWVGWHNTDLLKMTRRTDKNNTEYMDMLNIFKEENSC